MREGYNNLHIVTVDGLDRIYEDGGILYEDGVITHVGDRAYIEEKAGELQIELKDGKGRYLFPGLINTHTHLYQDIMKGMGSDLSLEDWFPKSMAPAGAVLRERHVAAGVKLGLAEAIRCGVTTVADYMQLQPVRGWENWSWISPKTWASEWCTAGATAISEEGAGGGRPRTSLPM